MRLSFRLSAGHEGSAVAHAGVGSWVYFRKAFQDLIRLPADPLWVGGSPMISVLYYCVYNDKRDTRLVSHIIEQEVPTSDNGKRYIRLTIVGSLQWQLIHRWQGVVDIAPSPRSSLFSQAPPLSTPTASVAEWLRAYVWHLDHIWSYDVRDVVSSIPDRCNIVGWVFHPTQVNGTVS